MNLKTKAANFQLVLIVVSLLILAVTVEEGLAFALGVLIAGGVGSIITQVLRSFLGWSADLANVALAIVVAVVIYTAAVFTGGLEIPGNLNEAYLFVAALYGTMQVIFKALQTVAPSRFRSS